MESGREFNQFEVKGVTWGKGYKTLIDLGQLPNGEKTTLVEYLNWLQENNLELVIRRNKNSINLEDKSDEK